jgi:hypothetical protein
LAKERHWIGGREQMAATMLAPSKQAEKICGRRGDRSPDRVRIARDNAGDPGYWAAAASFAPSSHHAPDRPGADELMYAKDVPAGTIFYHGTKASFRAGDLLSPGSRAISSSAG